MSKYPRETIIPVFIENKGCIKRCLFCDQKNLAPGLGQITKESIEKLINGFRSSNPATSAILAFYGGSFSNLERSEKEVLFGFVKKFLSEGLLKGLRVSTTPDSITKEEMDFLTENGVESIELGVQSTDPEILSFCRRNYDFKGVQKAVSILKEKNIKFGLHFMLGLPLSSKEKDRKSLLDGISLNPSFVRIHPTIVVKNTGLENLYLTGAYKPMSLEEAVERAAEALLICHFNAVPVARLGLHIEKKQVEDGLLVAGPVHFAFRQLVENHIYRQLILENLHLLSRKTQINFKIRAGELSNFLGHKKNNFNYFTNELNLNNFTVLEIEEGIEKYQLKVDDNLIEFSEDLKNFYKSD